MHNFWLYTMLNFSGYQEPIRIRSVFLNQEKPMSAKAGLFKLRPFFFFFREHLDFWRKVAKYKIDSKRRPFFFFFREHLHFGRKIAESEIDSR